MVIILDYFNIKPLLILRPPNAKSWLIGKDSDVGRDWGQEKKTTEDEMAGWYHQLDGCEFEWIPGVGDGQGDLECCDGVAKSRTPLRDWTELNFISTYLDAPRNWVEYKNTLIDFSADNDLYYKIRGHFNYQEECSL